MNPCSSAAIGSVTAALGGDTAGPGAEGAALAPRGASVVAVLDGRTVGSGAEDAESDAGASLRIEHAARTLAASRNVTTRAAARA